MFPRLSVPSTLGSACQLPTSSHSNDAGMTITLLSAELRATLAGAPVTNRPLNDDEATWPVTRVARGDLATEIAAIKAEPGPDAIVWGGGRFAGALAAADLIDEYRLLVQPLVLGQGRALFDQLPDSRHMNLIEALSFSSGIVVHIYRPQHI